MGRECNHNGRRNGEFLTGKPIEMGTLQRPMRWMENYSTIYLKEMGSIRETGLIRLRLGIIGESLWML